MKWSEIRRLAEDNGWVLVRFGKKHDVYEKEGKRLYLERHPSAEIKSGLYHKILRELGIK